MQVDASRLLPIREPTDVGRGDLVYEPIRFGVGAEHVKYQEYEVLGVLRQAVRCKPRTSSRSEPLSISFNRLRRLAKEPAAMSRRPSSTSIVAAPPVVLVPPPSSPAALASAGTGDDALEAWLDMGRELVAELEREHGSSVQRAAEVRDQLAGIDALHRRRIEALESELRGAKEEHARERSVAQGLLQRLTAKVEMLEQRRAGIASIVGTR